jgi:hypothetical protein
MAKIKGRSRKMSVKRAKDKEADKYCQKSQKTFFFRFAH